MKVFSKTVSIATKALLTLGGILCLFSMLIGSVNAIMRYFFNSPIVWGDELAAYCVIIMVFITMPYLELTDDQICIGFITGVVKSKKWLKFLEYFRSVIGLGITVVMVIVGYDAAQRSFNRNVITAVLRMPKGILYGIVTACYAIAAIVWILIMARKGVYIRDN